MLYIFGGRDSAMYLCVQHEREFLLQFFFSFLLILGPPLPKARSYHSTLEIHGDAFIFSGYDEFGYDSGNNYNSVIYQLTCSSGICSWSIINQELKVTRSRIVAIPVPDTFCV